MCTSQRSLTGHDVAQTLALAVRWIERCVNAWHAHSLWHVTQSVHLVNGDRALIELDGTSSGLQLLRSEDGVSTHDAH